MANFFKELVELADLIKKENQDSKELPTSDDFLKIAASSFAQVPEKIIERLDLLKDSHFIFIINIVHPDPKYGDVIGIDAYVYADKSLVEKLKASAEKRLESIYEGQYYKKASANSIERELFPQVKKLNNTPIGRALHEYVSLRSCVMMLDANPDEFIEEWRISRLKQLAQEFTQEDVQLDIAEESEHEEVVEVHDEERKEEPIDINPNSPWGRLSRRYSADILIKAHFRKYEFGMIKKLVRTGRITSIEMLMHIRNEAMTMEKKADENPIVKKVLPDLIDLRRYVQARLNIIKKREIEEQVVEVTESEEIELSDEV